MPSVALALRQSRELKAVGWWASTWACRLRTGLLFARLPAIGSISSEAWMPAASVPDLPAYSLALTREMIVGRIGLFFIFC